SSFIRCLERESHKWWLIGHAATPTFTPKYRHRIGSRRKPDCLGGRTHHPLFSWRMSFKFKTKVVPSGNATAVEVPKAGIESFGAGARPPVAISINGHRWRSRIAVKGGKSLVGISAANRGASNIAEGDLVEVLIELDEEPRTVPEPAD